MKKMILSAAAFAVVAVTAMVSAPTTSEAIPAFARQTGASCLACHNLSFPALNAFGRSFKQGGFTDVGEQALIEDDDLSITSAVNFSAVLRSQFVSQNTAAGTAKSISSPADTVLLIGGRVGSNTGVFIEYEGAFANYQLINSWDVGDYKAGISIFNTGFGETAGMEVGSTFGQHGGMMNGKALSASNTMSTTKGAIGDKNIGGVTLFVANDLVTASVSGVTTGLLLAGGAGGTANDWKLAPSGRIFVNTEVNGFELGFGGGVTSGTAGNAGSLAAIAGLPLGTTAVKMKKWMIDAQVQGEIGDMGFAAYADYASASAPGVGEYNLFNKGGTVASGNLHGYSFRALLKPTHTVIVSAGVGELKDNASKTRQWQISGEYEIYQNFVVALIYNNSKMTPALGLASTTKTLTLDIEALL
jgi:hypothetical protein